MSEFLTLREFGAIVRKSDVTVYGWCRSGRLPFCKIGGRIMFERREVSVWLKAQRTGGYSDADACVALDNAAQAIQQIGAACE
jgi:excisionase family DNA binding protein